VQPCFLNDCMHLDYHSQFRIITCGAIPHSNGTSSRMNTKALCNRQPSLAMLCTSAAELLNRLHKLHSERCKLEQGTLRVSLSKVTLGEIDELVNVTHANVECPSWHSFQAIAQFGNHPADAFSAFTPATSWTLRP